MVFVLLERKWFRQNRLIIEVLPTEVSPINMTLKTRSGVIGLNESSTEEVKGAFTSSVRVVIEEKSALVSP